MSPVSGRPRPARAQGALWAVERGWEGTGARRAGGVTPRSHLGELVYEVLLLQDLQLQEVNISFILALVQVV